MDDSPATSEKRPGASLCFSPSSLSFQNWLADAIVALLFFPFLFSRMFFV
jgi:hypothetical protein